MPTIGDAVEALNDLCIDLASALKQIADISAELSARDHVRVDNIQEVRLNIKSFAAVDLLSLDCQHSRRRLLTRARHCPKAISRLPGIRANKLNYSKACQINAQ